jgi:trans-aconitate 2-methyltransferase
MWDPRQYAKFSSERARPFLDLLAQVRLSAVRNAADLGCGPGEMTRLLAERWPEAQIVGVDNSEEMLAKAAAHAIPGRLRFERGDLESWRATEPLDLLISNAALHWAKDHERLLASWSSMLAPGGVLAVQMPYRFRTRSQRAIDAVVREPRWSERLAGVGLGEDSVKPLSWHVRCLQALGLEVNAWKTTYYHILSGDDPVLEWLKGTGLRPLLARLNEQQTEDFLQELGGRLRAAYPKKNGTTLLPFPRLFFVATLSSGSSQKPLLSLKRVARFEEEVSR